MINTARLRQLATHLRTGKLAHDVFDFGVYHGALVTGEGFGRTCNTLGCALGECPAAFPDSWGFLPRDDAFEDRANPQLYPRLKGSSGLTPGTSAEQFFGINHYMVGHLFHPGQQVDLSDTTAFLTSSSNNRAQLMFGDQLRAHATKEAVADNIDAFCNWAEREGHACD